MEFARHDLQLLGAVAEDGKMLRLKLSTQMTELPNPRLPTLSQVIFHDTITVILSALFDWILS